MNLTLILTVFVSVLAFLIDARLTRAILSLFYYFISNLLSLMLGKSKRKENWVFTPSSSWSTFQGRIKKENVPDQGYENLKFDINGEKFNIILNDPEKIMNIKWVIERYNRGEIFCKESYDFFGWFMFEGENARDVINNILSGVCYKAKFTLPIRCYKEEKVLNDEFLKPLLLINSILMNIESDKRLNYILISFSILTIFLRGEIYSQYILFKKIIIKFTKIVIVKLNLIRLMLFFSAMFPSFENCEEISKLYIYTKQKTMLTLNGFNLNTLGEFKILDSFKEVGILGTRVISVGDSIFQITSYKQKDKIIYKWETKKGPFTDVYKSFSNLDLRGISKFEYIIKNLGELMSPVVSYDGIMSHKQKFREFLMSNIDEYTIINLEDPKMILFSDKLSLSYRESLIFNSFKLYYGERNSRKLFLHNYHFFGKSGLKISVLCSVITCVGIMKELSKSIGNCKYKLYRCHVKSILKDLINLRFIEDRYLLKAPENPSIIYCNDESHEIEVVITKPMIIHGKDIFKIGPAEGHEEKDLSFDEIEKLASNLDCKRKKQVMSLVKQLKSTPNLSTFSSKKIEEIESGMRDKRTKIQKIISESSAPSKLGGNKSGNETSNISQKGGKNSGSKMTYKEVLLIDESLLQEVKLGVDNKINELNLLRERGAARQEALKSRSTGMTEIEGKLNNEILFKGERNAEFISSINKQIRPRGYLDINSMISLSPKMKDFYQNFKNAELEKVKSRTVVEGKKSILLIRGITEDDWIRPLYPSYITNANNYFTGGKVLEILRSDEKCIEENRAEEIRMRLKYLKELRLSILKKNAAQRNRDNRYGIEAESLVEKLNILKNEGASTADKMNIIKEYKGWEVNKKLSKGMNKLKLKTGVEHYGLQINKKSFCLKMNELENAKDVKDIKPGHLMNKFLRISREYDILRKRSPGEEDNLSSENEKLNYAKIGEIIHLGYSQN